MGKKIDTPLWFKEAVAADMQKYRGELERKKNSWDTSLERQITAADRALEILPADNSKTLRQVITDPEEYGYGTGTR
jgi:phospholipase/lecithinase/hemolysin